MRKTLPVLRQRLGRQLDGHRYVRVVRHQSPQVQMRFGQPVGYSLCRGIVFPHRHHPNWFWCPSTDSPPEWTGQVVEVFREVHRVLRPGGHFVLSFSNRMFAPKAVGIWRDSGDSQHVWTVAAYFHYCLQQQRQREEAAGGQAGEEGPGGGRYLEGCAGEGGGGGGGGGGEGGG